MQNLHIENIKIFDLNFKLKMGNPVRHEPEEDAAVEKAGRGEQEEGVSLQLDQWLKKMKMFSSTQSFERYKDIQVFSQPPVK